MRRRKASLRITLVFIGAASLAGCGRSNIAGALDAPEARRDEYASLQDCLADWDSKPENCSAEVADSRKTGQQSRASGNFPYYTRYWGPGYDHYSDGRRAYHAANGVSSFGSTAPSRSIGSSSVSRSGFGSSAHAHSSSGS